MGWGGGRREGERGERERERERKGGREGGRKRREGKIDLLRFVTLLEINVTAFRPRALGTFLESCQGCEIQKNGKKEVLACTKCAKPCGAKVVSSMTFSDCSSKTFSNNAGTLECEASAAVVPAGSYEARYALCTWLVPGYPDPAFVPFGLSCRFCRMVDPETLECECARPDGSSTVSSVRCALSGDAPLRCGASVLEWQTPSVRCAGQRREPR